MKTLLAVYLVVLLCELVLTAERQGSRLSVLKSKSKGSQTLLLSMEEARHMVESRLRERRASGQSNGGMPIIHGNFSFQDSNNYAIIHYSGSNSPVILILTYSTTQGSGSVSRVRLYRSDDYGASFTSILENLDSTDTSPSIWNDFFVSPINKNMIVIHHATNPVMYVSFDEGETWARKSLPTTVNPRSFVWNSYNDHMALAHDSVRKQLYVTSDLASNWTKIADYVDSPEDYQWGDPSVDPDSSVVFFNTFDPTDVNRADFTVSLQTQRYPFNGTTIRTFDPHLGRHDGFVVLGRYIFAQKTDSEGVISLHVSFDRHPFKKAMIAATDPHLNYIVSHINQLQAMVIVEHASTQYNLYLSDVTGVYYSLSLPDLVYDDGSSSFDLEMVEGVNGTILANQYVRSESRTRVRSLISLDNGAYWELVRSPTSEGCIPPQCSLHLNMATSAYFRTGIYSQASAPGIVLAHGNTGRNLDSSHPDLYISRDGGVTWSLTLQGSWGVTVVDHGGLLVAAKDYHPPPSTELRYSCDEGISWSTFDFTTTSMTVFGVLTEPGEHTTTVSLYGLKVNTTTWHVVTVNFSSIFPSMCSASDYYAWHPWDVRTDEECILGGTVTIERRNASRCCLIGQDYSRPIQFTVCPCFEDDFECDYGYQHADDFDGPCIRDDSITLPEPCTGDTVSYNKSLGYRKVAGDVCVGGEEERFAPVETLCISSNCSGGGHQVAVVVLAVFLALALAMAIIFAALALLAWTRCRKLQSAIRPGRVQFRSDSPTAQALVTSGTEDDDDAPLAL